MPDDFDDIERRFGGKAPAAPVADDFDAIEARFAAPGPNLAKQAITPTTVKGVREGIFGPQTDYSGQPPVLSGAFRGPPREPSKSVGDMALDAAASAGWGIIEGTTQAADAFGRMGRGIVDVANEGVKKAFGVKFDLGEESARPITGLADPLMAKAGQTRTLDDARADARAEGKDTALDVGGKIGEKGAGLIAMMAGAQPVAAGLAKAGVVGPLNNVLSFAGGSVLTDPKHPVTAAINGAFSGVGGEMGSALIKAPAAALLARWAGQNGARAAHVLRGLAFGTGMAAAPHVDESGGLHNVLMEGDGLAAAETILLPALLHAGASRESVRAATDSLRADAAKVAADPVRDEPTNVTLWRGRMREAEAEGVRLREAAKAEAQAEAAREAATRPEAEPTPGEPVEVTLKRGENRLAAQAAPEAAAAPREEVIQPRAEAKPETPEDVARELDAPVGGGRRGERGAVDPDLLIVPMMAAKRGLADAYDALNTTTAPNITRESPAARDSARELAGVEAHRDAIGKYLQSEIKARGIDPEVAGGVLNEGNLRGVRDQFVETSRSKKTRADEIRSEIEDARRSIEDEAADYVSRTARASDSLAFRKQMGAQYVLSKTRADATETIRASRTEADAKLAEAKTARDEAVAEARNNLGRTAEQGEKAAVDDAVREIESGYKDRTQAIEADFRAIRKEAVAEVQRAKKQAERTDWETAQRVETDTLRAEAQADRARRAALNKRSMKDRLSELRSTENESLAALEDAARVKSRIGEGGRFKTEAEYEEAKADPKVRAFLEEVVVPLRETYERNYRDSQGIAPEVELSNRNPDTGIRVNLVPSSTEMDFSRYGGTKPAKPDAASLPSSAGSPGNVRIRKSPFAKKAHGTAESYNDNIVDMLLHTHQRGAENAAKHRFYRDLVADGNAVFIKPGAPRPEMIGGERAVEIKEVEIPALGGRENRRMFVRESMAGEVRGLTRAEQTLEGPKLARALNAVSVGATIGDSFANMGNAIGSVFGRNSLGIHPAAEAGLRGALRLDVIPKAVQLVRTLASVNTPGFRAQLMKIAEQGGARDYSRVHDIERGSKNPLNLLSRITAAIDSSARVMSSRAYDSLAANGHIKNPSATGRVDFIQKQGNYQRRAMGAISRKMVESGFSPFQVAGKGRLIRGVDTLLGNTGIRDAGAKMRAYGIAQAATGWAGAGGLAYAITYALTGSAPPDGAKFGVIYTGRKNEDGKPEEIDLLRHLGQRDAMRIVGADAYVQARANGLPHEVAVDSAFDRAASAWMALVRGPIPNAASIATFGHPLIGGGRKTTAPAASSEETEWDNKVLAGLLSFAPSLRMIPAAVQDAGGTVPDWMKVDTTFKEEFGKQFSYFDSQLGLSDVKRQGLPEAVEYARGMEQGTWISKRVYDLPVEKRKAWVDAQLARIKDPEVRAFVERKINRKIQEALAPGGN